MKQLFFISTLFISVSIFSQRPSTGLWLSIYAPVQLNNKWQWHNDGGYRTLGNTALAIQYLYRTGLRYNFNKKWNAASGVALFANRATFSKLNDEFTKELRFWEEVNLLTEVTNKINILARCRIEQRCFAAISTKSKFNAFRYRVKLQVQNKISNKCTLQLANEFMQQNVHNKWSFDQNRLITTCLYSLNKQSQLQMGYMWLLWPEHSSQHILTIGFQKTILIHEK